MQYAFLRTILSNMSFTRIRLSAQKYHTHYELETTINFLSSKLAISGVDTLSLDPSIKTYTDAILQVKLICRYICHHSILLYLYVYEFCTQLHLTTVFKE